MNCPHCDRETPILIFHDNGHQSCRQCAPEVRKLPKEQTQQKDPMYHKTTRGYLVAR